MNNQSAINKTLKMIKKYNLIEEGDKIAIGLSGGKDSLFLLKILNQIQKFYNKHFDIVAFTINMKLPNMNLDGITKFCQEEGVELHIVESDIYEVVFNIRQEKNPCSLCAKLRRGMLCSSARKYGCNKLALGHNSDDLIETFFLSLIYEGRFSTIMPKSYLSRSEITVIRPILLISEKEITDYILSNNIKITKNLCPADHHTKREEIKNFTDELNKRFKGSKDNILNAILHPERNNLWKDKDIE